MPPLSAHIGYLFNEVPLEQRFAAAAAAGFDRVETPAPYALPAERVRDLCAENGLSFVQMALPSGDVARGEKGLACLPDRKDEFARGIEKAITYANTIDAGFVHPMSGVSPDPAQWQRYWPTYMENLQLTCRAAADAGIDVLIEPIGPGTLPNYFMHDHYAALRAIEESGADNVYLLLDTFHAVNAGIDPSTFAREHAAKIRHVHIADHPGRHEPGTGNIDFKGFFAELAAQGYAGSAGLEYIPAGATLDGLGWRTRFA